MKRQHVTRATAAIVVAGSLFAASCGALGAGGNSAESDGLSPGDYTIASAEGVTDSVIVNGTIAPVRAVSITTPLQSEVRTIAVAPGDRVQVEQLLAAMDTEQLERQLSVQERQQANAQAEAQAGVDQAQAQLNALNQSLNDGTNPTIRQAQAQVNQAQAAYDAAVAANGGPRLVRPLARISSHINDFFGGYLSHAPAPAPEAPAPAPAPGAPAPAPGAPAPAPGAPAPAPSAPSVNQAEVAQVTGGGATVSVAEAYAALQDAQANLAAARAQVEQERSQLQAQVNSASRQVEMAQLEAGDGTLEYQVQEATIYSPINGVVTSVDVQEGDIPQGRVLSLADDSRLLIRAELREADVPNVAKGNRVVFTSTATGNKEFTGRVTRISPAAAESNDPMAAVQGGGGDAGVVFPVEIEVTGNTDGLLLGGSARAEIITQESDDALNIPVDAVFEEDGEKKVLVLATDNDEARSGQVTERIVETGASNDIDVAVTGGELEAGDIVITWPEDYMSRVGETVEITDSGFDPADVAAARDGGEQDRERTTTTVTVTSTTLVQPEAPADEAEPSEPAAAN